MAEERVVDAAGQTWCARAARGRRRRTGAARTLGDATVDEVRHELLAHTERHRASEGANGMPGLSTRKLQPNRLRSHGVIGVGARRADYESVSGNAILVDEQAGATYDSDGRAPAACSCSASHCAIRSPTSHISAWCRSMTGFDASRSS